MTIKNKSCWTIYYFDEGLRSIKKVSDVTCGIREKAKKTKSVHNQNYDRIL